MSNLVVINGQLKQRLQSQALRYGSFVHVDFLRFTVQTSRVMPSVLAMLRPPLATPLISDPADPLFGTGHEAVRDLMEPWLVGLDDSEEISKASAAYELGTEVCSILGSDFSLAAFWSNGCDFYKYRYKIYRAGSSVGWIGFCAGGKGKHSTAQDKTIHVCLEGMACTFADHGWLQKMADLIDSYRGLITRCDLALDFFSGLQGGMLRFPKEYQTGLMDHLGHHPKHGTGGTWFFTDPKDNGGRSFYFGSREAGKITNIYEKGIQLFGKGDTSEWVRVELRWGNQKRLLPTDMLRRPSDFFGGASDWHAAILKEHGDSCNPEPIPCKKQLEQQTVEAEVTRNVKWFLSTAGKSALLSFLHLPMEVMGKFLDQPLTLPRRLAKFKEQEVVSCYHRVFESVANAGRIGISAA